MENIATSSWFVPLLAVIMGVGLLGLLFYIIPGLTIIWAAALVYGLVEGFTAWGWVIFAFMTVQMLVGVASDNVIMGASAKTYVIIISPIGYVVLTFITFHRPIRNFIMFEALLF